jgi:hypothetical protein
VRGTVRKGEKFPWWRRVWYFMGLKLIGFEESSIEGRRCGADGPSDSCF